MIKTRVGLTNSEAKASKKRLCIRAALHRIATQFPDCPEANLMFAIIDQAAVDLLNWGYREEAKRYLMYSGHAELCGVDPVWIRETFEKLGCFDDVSSKGPTCQ